MSEDWRLVKLENITTVIGDGLHGTPQYDDFGEYHFINGNNLKNGKILINENTKRASKSEYVKHKKNLTDRTILISINGTLGNVALYDGEKVFLGKSACYINIVNEVNKLFVMYVLSSNLFQDYIHKLATGSTIKNVSLKLIRNFEFYLPPFNLQSKIAKILGDLDSKITLNRQINQTLEAMAQALFKSWFVDFEPVKAKMAALASGGHDDDANLAAMSAISGKTIEQLLVLKTENPAQYQQLYDIAVLFPSEMVESELGEVPKGWEVFKTQELVKRIPVGKKFDQKSAAESGRVPILDQGKTGIIGYHDEEPGVKASPDDPVIVFANHTCFMRLISFDFSAIQNVLPFVGNKVNTVWLYYATIGKVVFSEYKGHWPELMTKFVVMPTNHLSESFGLTVLTFHKIIQKNIDECSSLEKVRDTLLPKLLSGELL